MITRRLEQSGKLAKHVVSRQLRYVLHADDRRANALDETREMLKQTPLFIGLLFLSASVAGESLARGTANEDSNRIRRIGGEQLAARNIDNVAVNEPGLIVRFKREFACRIEVNARDYRDARLDHPMREPPDPAKQVHCGDGLPND